ncbi:DUF2651 family protein [Clostridium beijerinckii]|uniref:DUF2651 family protein n=1 Tax=Clostridium beijerinckii TaxID=1520 RepID=UPI002225F6E8|nr:DUF2651 family protein [Clostridium beijerinckii]UYZ36816.1 DUF2651 family protein [Clostridium beijerinckii]
MSTFSINDNPFGMMLIILPLLTFTISLILQLLVRKKVIVLSIAFIGYLIATFILFNSTFLIW